MSILGKMKGFGSALLCLSATCLWAEDEGGPRELGCIAQTAVQRDHSPSELARAVRACINEGAYAQAMQVYYTYSAFTLFDQQRVRDETAHIVLQDLTPWIFLGYPYAVMAELKAQADRLRDTEGAFLAETCATLRATGWPVYRPTYMIRQGMIPRKHAEDWGHADFDPAVAWERAVSEVNNCPPA